MNPIGSSSRWNRFAMAFLLLTLAVLALEVWGIRSSIGSLLR
ncbi:MAG TPA: hypothetical protein VK780_10320 [Thermoanaerobaculia bacterium]|nr:hypothetical protein [Thermoanaerobaculia bacterium]